MVRKHLYSAISAAILILGPISARGEMDGAANEDATLSGVRLVPHGAPGVRVNQRGPAPRGAGARTQRDRGDARDQGQRGAPRPDPGRAGQRNPDLRADWHDPGRNGAPPVYRSRDPDHGVGPGYRFRHGDRLPYHYRGTPHVVDDWRSRRLAPPAPGQHWVDADGDYLLIAIATGVILQILLAD